MVQNKLLQPNVSDFVLSQCVKSTWVIHFTYFSNAKVANSIGLVRWKQRYLLYLNED